MRHITRIKPRQHSSDPYIPQCKPCGWEGPLCHSRQTALDEIGKHHESRAITPDQIAELEMEAGFTQDYDDPQER
jgi:hypothetical protein